MKKILSAICLSLLICLTACGPKIPQGNLRGHKWLFDKMVQEGGNIDGNTVVFEEAALNCFIGSTWTFGKDGRGYYEIRATNGKSCTNIRRDFYHLSTSGNPQTNTPASIEITRLDNAGNRIGTKKFLFYFTEITPNSAKLRNTFEINGQPVTATINLVKL